jgi:DNA invertase Pin-like site-specific DNA recombinase
MVYSDRLTGTSTSEQRAGLSALLDYARPGDVIVFEQDNLIERPVDSSTTKEAS